MKRSLGTVKYISSQGPPIEGIVRASAYIEHGSEVYGQSAFLRLCNGQKPSAVFTRAHNGLMLDVKGHIIVQEVLKQYSYEQCSNKTQKQYGSWRRMDDFVSIFSVLAGKNCPTDRDFADLAEDFILEMESEFPRNSLKTDEEVWKECAQKAKAFLATPTVQQLLQEEPNAKKQRVAQGE